MTRQGNIWSLLPTVLALCIAVGVSALTVPLSMRKPWQCEGDA